MLRTLTQLFCREPASRFFRCLARFCRNPLGNSSWLSWTLGAWEQLVGPKGITSEFVSRSRKSRNRKYWRSKLYHCQAISSGGMLTESEEPVHITRGALRRKTQTKEARKLVDHAVHFVQEVHLEELERINTIRLWGSSRVASRGSRLSDILSTRIIQSYRAADYGASRLVCQTKLEHFLIGNNYSRDFLRKLNVYVTWVRLSRCNQYFSSGKYRHPTVPNVLHCIRLGLRVPATVVLFSYFLAESSRLQERCGGGRNTLGNADGEWDVSCTLSHIWWWLLRRKIQRSAYVTLALAVRNDEFLFFFNRRARRMYFLIGVSIPTPE